jgi:hypothetical protein
VNNVFVKLQEIKPHDLKTLSKEVYVNMSRVQEMRFHNKLGYTELTMNIPGYIISVLETPATILHLLDLVNNPLIQVPNDKPSSGVPGDGE